MAFHKIRNQVFSNINSIFLYKNIKYVVIFNFFFTYVMTFYLFFLKPIHCFGNLMPSVIKLVRGIFLFFLNKKNKKIQNCNRSHSKKIITWITSTISIFLWIFFPLKIVFWMCHKYICTINCSKKWQINQTFNTAVCRGYS